jgi:thiamine-phosphate pyrophosphorylase
LQSAPDHPIVCYVTDGREFPPENRHRLTLERIRGAIHAGVDLLHIREKDLGARSLLAHVRGALEIARASASGVRILVNDRLDVALAAGAAGVHLRAESARADAIIRWCRSGNAPADFWIGASCHSLAEARKAEAAEADYAFWGPIFDTPAKRIFGEPLGIGSLAEVCRTVSIPVVAIGGINAENAEACLRAGAAGVAAIRLFQDLADAAALADFVSRLHAL